MSRHCYHVDESFYDDGRYLLALIAEDEPGYTVAATSTNLETARELVKERNAALGLTDEDVLQIRASSMAASRANQTFQAEHDPDIRTVDDLPEPEGDFAQLDGYPEAANRLRAERAGVAVRAYAELSGPGLVHEDVGVVIKDLLGDLMHLCDLTDTNFDALLDSAQEMYGAEVRDEP